MTTLNSNKKAVMNKNSKKETIMHRLSTWMDIYTDKTIKVVELSIDGSIHLEVQE